MRRLTLSVSLFLASLFAPLLAWAGPDTLGKLEGTGQKAGFSKNTSIFDIISVVINAALGILGFIFFVLLVYAGYMWLIAGGDEGKVEVAKATITRAVIGLVIVLAAFAISNFVVPAVYCASNPEADSCVEVEAEPVKI